MRTRVPSASATSAPVGIRMKAGHCLECVTSVGGHRLDGTEEPKHLQPTGEDVAL